MERVKHVLRKVRSDPPIAPDEPVPITLRPIDVKPGDESRWGRRELNWFLPVRGVKAEWRLWLENG